MIFRILCACSMALVLGLIAERAKASQVFLCEDGKSVQIAAADLEEAKRFDPCVARYFGRTIDPAAVPLPLRRPDRKGVRADVAALAKALRAGALQTHADRPANAGSAKARPVAETASPSGTPQTTATTAPKKGVQPPRASTLRGRLAALGSGDYRNVRVINGDGSSGWFRHER